MKYRIILLFILLIVTFSEAEALRNDNQDIFKNFDSFNRTITLNPSLATEQRIESIREVVYSEEVLSIPDILLHKGPKGINSDYYLGWQLALNQVQDTKLDFKVSSNPGDISINLVNFKSSLAGRTNYYGDRAVITIYDVDEYTPNSLKTILRHELGHAFGLGHTTADEELMYPIINQVYPYISSCNIMALSQNNQTEILCEK
jgi:hypothetical protein